MTWLEAAMAEWQKVQQQRVGYTAPSQIKHAGDVLLAAIEGHLAQHTSATLGHPVERDPGGGPHSAVDDLRKHQTASRFGPRRRA